MFEVGARAGLARAGTWTVEGRAVPTPNVLFAVTPRHPTPPFGDLLLSETPSGDARPTVVDRGSVFRPHPPTAGLEIPPDSARPATLPDLERPDAERGLITVAGPTEDLTDPQVEVVAVADAIAYLRRPKGFVAAVVELRRAAGYHRILYAPGLAVPGNLAILAYAGVDLVDSTRVLFESTLGRFHTGDGSWPVEALDRDVCACPACADGAGTDVAAHNGRALLAEARYVAMAVRTGRLRELAERRAANDPWTTVVLREMDLRHYAWQEYHAAVEGGPLLAYSAQSLTRPEVLRYRRRIAERYAKPPSARVLLLLPCSARKPYATSRSHRRFRDAVWRSGNAHAVHEVSVTSPFGLVPRDLERMYPVAHYDVPVTGDWSRDEVAMLQGDLLRFLAANAYDAVVAHLGTEAPFVAEVVPDAAFTAEEKVSDAASLDRLARVLLEALREVPKVSAKDRLREDLRNVAAFQFGPEGAALVEGATFRGRYPNVRILQGGRQVGMFTERGKISLTLAGGALLSERGIHWVEIEDFRPEGSVFAVGVTAADERIRVGDEVAVRHGGEVRAVGVAAMNPREMVDSQRGAAVKVRHRAKKA